MGRSDEAEKDAHAAELLKAYAPGSVAFEAAVEHLTRSADKLQAQVIRKAADLGLALSFGQARALIETVTSYHDEVIQVGMLVSAALWRDESGRRGVRDRIQRSLARDLLRHGKIPVAVPDEAVIEHDDMGAVSVVLSVPVRKAK